MKAEAEFFFESENKELMREIYASLLPEAGDPISDRSVIFMNLDEAGRLILNIQSSDVISLRSALNTWLRLIQTAYDVSAIVV
ncbi:KEOPS complex subunit Pcc1 [Methanolapillus ohkumae]|uniref:Uncharacterized protein n=1 Tax=Methanolapillus ohkumae TaxID=3028298 RepID=A0AA96ZWS1_9EURY|nr:hypothetical protein MsAm2_06670 [Methanosarcinaceae archaeon Am2]